MVSIARTSGHFLHFSATESQFTGINEREPAVYKHSIPINYIMFTIYVEITRNKKCRQESSEVPIEKNQFSTDTIKKRDSKKTNMYTLKLRKQAVKLHTILSSECYKRLHDMEDKFNIFLKFRVTFVPYCHICCYSDKNKKTSNYNKSVCDPVGSQF